MQLLWSDIAQAHYARHLLLAGCSQAAECGRDYTEEDLPYGQSDAVAFPQANQHRAPHCMEEDDEQLGKGRKIAALQTLQEEKADLQVAALLAGAILAHLLKFDQSGRIILAVQGG